MNVIDVRRPVEIGSNAVTGESRDDIETLGRGISLNGLANGSKGNSRATNFDATIQTVSSHCHKVLASLVNIANQKRL